MGVINHNAVIGTTWSDDYLDKLLKYLKKEEINNYAISNKQINAYTTIIIFPDGSKEGWKTSNYWDVVRDNIIRKIESFNYEDGSNPFDYIEVGYGEFGQKVLRGNNVNCYNDKEYYE